MMLDQEADAAATAFPYLDKAAAVREWRRDIAERMARTAQREADAAEKIRLAADDAAKENWKAHNRSFAELTEGYIAETVDADPPTHKPFPGDDRHERPRMRLIGFLILENRALVKRVEALEAAASKQ